MPTTQERTDNISQLGISQGITILYFKAMDNKTEQSLWLYSRDDLELRENSGNKFGE